MRSGLEFLALNLVFGGAMLLAAGPSLTTTHIPELTDVHQELQAECIAIMLDGKPKKEWRSLAVEYAQDSKLCREVMMMPTKTILPMHGGNWRERLDVGRSAVSP